MDNNPFNSKLEKLISSSLRVKLVDCGSTHINSYNPNYRPIWSASVVSFLEKGKVKTTFDNSTKSIQRKKNSVHILAEKTPYQTQILSPGGVTFVWSHIYFRIMESIDLISLLKAPILIKDKKAAKKIGKYNKRLIKLFQTSSASPVTYAETQSICYKILSIILSHSQFRDDITVLLETQQRLTPLVQEIAKHYKDQWTIEQMTKIACLSKSRLHHIFKDIYGQSPLEYATSVRLHKAQQLLLTTDLQISEIAEETGYEDPLYFSRCFTKLFGLSPSHYRKAESQ